MKDFLAQLGWELYRMFVRKRTWIGFWVFLALEGAILGLLHLPRINEAVIRIIGRSTGSLDTYFSALTVAFIILLFTVFLLGAVALSLVCGDILANEQEDGNLRLLLARPVSRLGLLVVKYLACQIYTALFFSFVVLLAFLVGLAYRGWGGGMLVLPSPEKPQISLFDWGEGLGRLALLVPFFTVVYLPVTSLSFCFSCTRMKPASATIITISILMADFVLAKIPWFEDYKHWFITPRMEKWVYAVHQHIPWPAVWETAIQLGTIGFTAFIIGWFVFERRDLKS